MEDLEFGFDALLFQIAKGNTHENLERNIRYDEFQQIPDWNLRYGYKFNIYSNDHLIDGKPHFHFDNEAQGILCKVDFNGNVLESRGDRKVPSKVLKELVYFLSKDRIKTKLIDTWNEKNPDLKQTNSRPSS